MKLFWSERIQNHIFLYYKGNLIYKRWVGNDPSQKTESSMIFNELWPNEKIG